MEKPLEPNKEDCCNSGCNPCIFDIYEKQLKLYEKYLETGKHNHIASEENGILQIEYTQFIVYQNVNICKSHNLITLKRQLVDSKKVWWKPGDHFLYKYSSSESSFTRAYTPIHVQNYVKGNYDFAIIVKKYDDGVVSSHLCSLDEGSITLWRGPYGFYEIKPNIFNRIIMIAQGTGIAAFINIIDNILNNEEDMTQIILLYCCKCVDTILFRDDLYVYKSYWNFKYEIYVSNNSNAEIRYHEPIKKTKLKSHDLFKLKPFSGNDQFLICGSEQFSESFKKDIQFEENIIIF